MGGQTPLFANPLFKKNQISPPHFLLLFGDFIPLKQGVLLVQRTLVKRRKGKEKTS